MFLVTCFCDVLLCVQQSGESTVWASHMYDAKAPALEIRVSNDDLQYSLRPKYLPSRDKNEPPIIYLGNIRETLCLEHLIGVL